MVDASGAAATGGTPLPECDDPSEVMSLFCCRLQLAHIGTYALPARVDKGAHIAGYALPDLGETLGEREQNASSRTLSLLCGRPFVCRRSVFLEILLDLSPTLASGCST